LSILTLLRWACLAAWLIWLLIYWKAGAGLAAGLWRTYRAPRSRRETYPIVGIILLDNILLWTGYLVTLGRLPLAWESAWLAGAGLACVLGGAAGTFYCRSRLGDHWSERTVLRDDHRVIDSGPYRLVRHPIYAFACLMVLGTLLVFPAWWNFPASLGMVGLYAFKALVEERLLAEHLPAYREYQQRVRYRLAPWVW